MISKKLILGGKSSQRSLTALLLALASQMAMARPAALPSEFAIKQAPSAPDWRFFMQASDADRQKLWVYQVGQGHHLKEWSWGWRLGWVRVCGRSDVAFCASVLQEALKDKALVVRAEAVTQIGQHYDGSGDELAVAWLAGVYADPRNERRGKPLFIQQRILYALHQIGGSAARQQGRQLAASRRDAATYWQQLEAGSGAL